METPGRQPDEPLREKHRASKYEYREDIRDRATLDEIARHGHVLTPGRYVGAEDIKEDADPFAEKYPRLVAEVEECLAESERFTNAIRAQLGRIEHV